MKKLVFLLIICSFFAATSVFGQQWSGSSNTNGNINRDGNVGIGISTPASRLDIKSNEYAVLGGGYDFAPQLRLQSRFFQFPATYIWDIKAASSLTFNYGTSTNNLSTALSVSQNNFTYNGSRLIVGTNENRFNLGVMNAPNSNAGHYIAFGADPLSGGWQFTGNSTNNGGAIIHGDNEGNLFFITRGTNASNLMNIPQTSDNVRLRIHGNGKISIGTGNTTNDINEDGDEYLLFIKGGTLAEEVAVQTGWADYVFEEDYQLLPLEAVEQHIDIYGHLHNTPSADELNGKVKLGDATVQQQEKIEEIYLHLIEMNKRMKILEAENDRLKAEMEELKK